MNNLLKRDWKLLWSLALVIPKVITITTQKSHKCILCSHMKLNSHACYGRGSPNSALAGSQLISPWALC